MKISYLLLACGVTACLSGCPAATPPTDLASPASATPTAVETFVPPPPATPGEVQSSEVKAGEGPGLAGSGGFTIEIKVWDDKFEGRPVGAGRMDLNLTPDRIPLPGLASSLEGMKKGGVRRLEIGAGDLFAEIPQGSGLTPTSRLFLEITLKDVYPKEPFEITTVKAGKGDKAAVPGDIVRVDYVGWLDGFESEKVFDSSRKQGRPFTVPLGKGRVIQGWEEGLSGMKKGETRRLSIPHYLAYGPVSQDSIPAKSRLFFEIELIEFVTPGKLVMSTVSPGQGVEIKKGETGLFHYTGWLDRFDGAEQFDSSHKRQQPFEVQVGVGQVIAGWDVGLVGMKPGEKRRLEIPYNLAYGAAGRAPVIPTYAKLYFEVEYLGPKSASASPTPAGSPTP